MAGIYALDPDVKGGKKRSNNYLLNPDSYNTMAGLRTLRESIQDDWVFINQLHGFTPSQPNI
jgi:hypothetical protein